MTLNGVQVDGVETFEVTNNNFYAADKFRLTLALDQTGPDFQAAYFAAAAELEVGIALALDVDGLAPAAPVQLILGLADRVDTDHFARRVTLTGRDFSSQFLENKTTERFQEKTSSDIAQLLALRRGLDSNVTQTTTKVGTFYQIAHAQMTREETEWDLLVFLARQEGFDLYVRGRTLFFHPASAGDNADAFELRYYPPTGDDLAQGGFVSLRTSRALTLARDVIVKVQTFNPKTGKSYIQTVSAIGASKSQRVGGKSQVYTITRPSLTPEQALKVGQGLLAEISKQEMLLDWSGPGDVDVTPQRRVQLVGTGTAADQLYFIDEITRSFGFDEGFRMHVHAKNHAVESTVPG